MAFLAKADFDNAMAMGFAERKKMVCAKLWFFSLFANNPNLKTKNEKIKNFTKILDSPLRV